MLLVAAAAAHRGPPQDFFHQLLLWTLEINLVEIFQRHRHNLLDINDAASRTACLDLFWIYNTDKKKNTDLFVCKNNVYIRFCKLYSTYLQYIYDICNKCIESYFVNYID